MNKILVCGGAGFIGSNFVRYWNNWHASQIIVFDKLTYCGSLLNLENLNGLGCPEMIFIEGDIADKTKLTFYDSLYISTATSEQALFLTEDKEILKHNHKFTSIRSLNEFYNTPM